MGDAEVGVINYNNNVDGLKDPKPSISVTNGQKASLNGVPFGTDTKPAPEIVTQSHVDTTINYEDLNKVIPASAYVSSNSLEPVKLRITDKEYANNSPKSIPYLFHQVVQRIPNVTAMVVKRDGALLKWSYTQYYEQVLIVAKAFIKLGLERGNGVGILGFNAPEWFLSNLGAIYAGGVAVGIYTTNTADACAFVAEDSKVNIMVVENHQQLQKILEVKHKLPLLKAIIVYSGEVAVKQPNIYSWQEIMDIGQEVPMSAVHETLKLIAPNKCCLVIYTSGTTGNPKGVMMSHDNLTWTANSVTDLIATNFGNEHIVSYLPLSHVAAQLLDIYLAITVGATVYFAQPDALKGTLAVTLQEVRPTVFLGVPRVWEKFVDGIKSAGRQSGSLKKKIAIWAKGVGLKGNYNRMNGLQSHGKFQRRAGKPLLWPVAKALVFKKVRGQLGLDRCRLALSAAAPIMKETLEFMMSLDIPVYETYGMSESTGPHTVSTSKRFRITSVGVDIPGSQTRLHSPDQDGNGEVCMYGRHIFMGYLNAPEKTNDALDEEGWLHSGDIGKKENEFLYITGRIKELIITAGGENIAPCPIEESVKEELPIISHCMLVGDKRKFLSILLTLKTEIDLDTQVPKDELTKVTKEWCRMVNSQANTVQDLLNGKDENVVKAIENGIERANKKAVSRAAKVQKWTILPADFSIPGGELGPTLKMRRPIIHKMYASTIEAFYS